MRSVSERIGIAIAGLNGAVASTVVAGVELIRRGLAEPVGLLTEDPAVRKLASLASLDDFVFAGWDPRLETELQAATRNDVVGTVQLKPVAPALRKLRAWPARWSAAAVRRDIAAFQCKHRLARVIVIALTPTEPVGRPGPSAIYARGAIEAGCPFINFTPNVADELPALRALAGKRGVPLAGKDGKTGQTMMKSVLAPAFRSRGLRVEGWFSTNLLGNEDGRTLNDPAAHRAKEKCKSDLLDQMLGYPVKPHTVQINYYPPRGDNKEAWDNIDLVGFLGKRMALKINFLCRDSILAAPLVIDLVRWMDLAARRGARGPQEWLGFYFKAPYSTGKQPVENGLMEQYRALLEHVRRFVR
ncbi:MAG: inositol-3-phosphate synthase [Verrucomicrobia bacterium]|nr:inositol-3-phosphate synthase [Verrucomicrobiota bacterium]